MAEAPVICVVDDDEAFRDSLQILLETVGYAVRAYDSGPAFLDACRDLETGCVLLDVHMPKMSGLEVQQQFYALRPDRPVIIVTAHGDVTMAVQAMKAGAVDFIEKPFQEETLLACVNNALSLAERSHHKNELASAAQQNIARLTAREREVFQHLVIGRANKVIARELDCSPRTVEIHRARVMEKMEASSIAHLVRMALAAGVEIVDG